MMSMREVAWLMGLARHPCVHQSEVIMTRVETDVLLLSTLTLSLGLDIVRHSSDLVIVKEGGDLDLYCDSSSPYQWCMWTHNGSVFWSELMFYMKKDSFKEWPVPDCGQPPDSGHRDGGGVSRNWILVDKVKHKMRAEDWKCGHEGCRKLEVSFRENCTFNLRLDFHLF